MNEIQPPGTVVFLNMKPKLEHTISDTILPEDLLKLSNLLEDSLETLSSGNEEIRVAALSATKHIFDLCMCINFRMRNRIQ
jgi:hypothetical protein